MTDDIADGQNGRPDIAQDNRADAFSGSARTEEEEFRTGAGNDTIYADGATSAISSLGGNDLIDSGAGRDVVIGGGGNDWIESGTEAAGIQLQGAAVTGGGPAGAGAGGGMAAAVGVGAGAGATPA